MTFGSGFLTEMILLLTLFVDDGAKLQNVYAPLPLGMHIGFCVLATILYAVLYMRRRKPSYLCLLAAVDLTVVTQFWTHSAVIATLFAAEVCLLTACIVFSYKAAKQNKLEIAAAGAPEEDAVDGAFEDEE